MYLDSLESSIVGTCKDALGEYHGRATVSDCDTTNDRARVVETPRWCMASEARNSRMLLLKTARPSPPRQKGVVPAPFNCSSSPWNSPMEMARPSPYPSPVPKGQLDVYRFPLIESAYGVAHESPKCRLPDTKLVKSVDMTSCGESFNCSATSSLTRINCGSGSPVGLTST